MSLVGNLIIFFDGKILKIGQNLTKFSPVANLKGAVLLGALCMYPIATY